jgi:hypothetical protein
MRFAASAFLALTIFFSTASLAFADKLAPPANKLQPLPVEVQPAVSENVQRAASTQDIQDVQQAASSEPQPASNVAPTGGPIVYNIAQSASSYGSIILAIVIALLIVVGGGVAWLWKKF